MLEWRSNSLAIMAVAAGVLSPCFMPFCVRAGDKIEFSAPCVSLEVPHVVREDSSELSTFKLRAPAQPPIQAEEMAAAEMQASSEFVFISTPEDKDRKRWDTVFTDNGDNDTDADSRYDNLNSGRRPIHGETNRWDMPGEWDPDAGSISDRRRDEAASQENLRGRLEALNKAEKTDYQRDGFYSRRFSDSDEDSSLSRGLYHHSSSGLERMRAGQFVPLYEEARMINEQASQGYSSARPAGTANSLSHDSMLTPGVAGYASERDVARGNSPDETGSASWTYHPAETTIRSQNSDRFARQEPAVSSMVHAKPPPAVLPFPKKPGSVFQ